MEGELPNAPVSLQNARSVARRTGEVQVQGSKRIGAMDEHLTQCDRGWRSEDVKAAIGSCPQTMS
jgi:hypothetical protein